ncbi:PIN domain-containing protein [Okeania sp. SIO1I7]|uniref:PIN domain-containing protein n=1 Tax=Okeania sp. SIO1I7 TaxID=2607772 RepID=UPI0013FC8546|nr:PIN domain-containing protein [Okeania sp. SIO1I7]NET24420.1 type II toxin-antitoxin system VapC family toxin [Okeania sp. SIO1I7]
MIRVYLDTSVYNRPFDDQTQKKIALETEAVKLIFQMIEEKSIILVSSEALELENRKNPYLLQKLIMSRYLQKATLYQPLNLAIKERANELTQQGIKQFDAYHVACAEIIQADYFLTCDKRLISRCQNLSLKTLNPVNFILDVCDENEPNP